MAHSGRHPAPGDLLKRVEALEAKQEADLDVERLPVQKLIRALEDAWQPEFPDQLQAGAVVTSRLLTNADGFPRIEINDEDGIVAYDAAGTIIVHIPVDGSGPSVLP